MDQRTWREARERLIRRIEVAWLVAIIHFVGSVAIIGYLTLTSGQLVNGWVSVVRAGVPLVLAFVTWRHHYALTAGTLAVLAALSPIVSYFRHGDFGTVIIPALLIFVYSRAFLATVELDELPSEPPTQAT